MFANLFMMGEREDCVVGIVVVVRIVGGDGRPRWRRLDLDGRGRRGWRKTEPEKNTKMRCDARFERDGKREKGYRIEEAWAINGWRGRDKGKGEDGKSDGCYL
jgi:hypothetical protein